MTGGQGAEGAALAVRDEDVADHDAVRAVLRAAFGQPQEAALVERLREEARPCVSLVAERAGRVCGHVLFTPVTLVAEPGAGATRTPPRLPPLLMGLAPLAVAPEHQRTGVGSALTRAGLERCVTLGAAAVVVLGHSTYYPRFGFEPASRFGLASRYDVPDEVFQALELRAGALGPYAGTVAYHRAFDEL